MPTRGFSFVNPHGQRLSGKVEMPERVVRGWALLAHCFSCGKDSRTAVALARGLAAQGIGVLRFDFSGVGKSEGNFDDTSFTLNVEDLVAAGDAMAEAGMPASVLIGHSLGGTAVLSAVSRMPSVRAVATIGAPFDASHLLGHASESELKTIDEFGATELLLGGFPVRIGAAFVEDLRQHDAGRRLAELKVPLMILHSPMDPIVDIENASRIFVAAHHSKSFVSLDKADHLMRDHADAVHASACVAAWAIRYLPDPQPLAAPSPDAEAEETGLGKFQLALLSGGSRWLADEPEAIGGLGSGPSPYNLLSSALAACTTMTIRHFAELKGWKVGRIRTGVSHRKRKDAEPADEFSRRITIEGELDDEQRARLIEVAQRCPVHRTLEAGAAFSEPVISD